MKDDFDGVVEPCKVLVNGVVHDLPNAMVQSRPVVRVTKVHAGSFSDRFKPLENLDASSVVIIAHFITSKMRQNRGAAGDFWGARMPLSSYKIYCSLRGINIPLFLTDKR